MDKIVSFFILFVFLACCACDEGLNVAVHASHLNDSPKEDHQLGSPQPADSMDLTENPEAGEELAGAETAQCCGGGYGGYGGGFRRFGGFGGYGGGFSRGYRFNRWGRSWGGGFGGFGCCG